jgi:hypothetical protein
LGPLTARDFHPSLWHAASPYPSSHVPLPSQEQAPESSGISSKFVPGNESESVLKLTKRPRLRPKDVSHRRSLAGGDLGFPSPSEGAASRPASSTVPTGSSGRLNLGITPGSSGDTLLRVILTFGSRQVNVPGSVHMPAGELRDVVGSIADRDPGSLLLMHGEFILQIGTVLGIMLILLAPMDFMSEWRLHLRLRRVARFPRPVPQPPILSSMGRSPSSPPVFPQSLLSSTTPRTPPISDTTSYLILAGGSRGANFATDGVGLNASSTTLPEGRHPNPNLEDGLQVPRNGGGRRATRGAHLLALGLGLRVRVKG